MHVFFRHIAGTDRITLLIFLLAFGLRFGYLMVALDQAPPDHFAATPSDSAEYVRLAGDFYSLHISNEHILYMVGFGYPFFLAAAFAISGQCLLFALIVQIVFGSAATALIYEIGRLIFQNRSLAAIAALINATSFTSLTLSVSFLSETVFFFLLALSVYVFLRMLEKPTLPKCLLLAILLAYTTFVRSVGQFLPVLFFAIVIITPIRYFAVSKARLLKCTLMAMVLSIMLISAWAMRNYVKHDTYVTSGTGIGAAAMYLGARVAANQSDSLTSGDFQEIFKKEMAQSQARPLSLSEQHDWYLRKLTDLLTDNPFLFVGTYLTIIGANILAYEDNYHFRLPDFRPRLNQYTKLCRRLYVNEIYFILTLFGFISLVHRREVFAAVLLGLIYLYFAALSGFTYWQGSRIFYPAQLSWAFAIAVVLERPVRCLTQSVMRLSAGKA
ncbi:MAG: glycosyltransferase family 39 protein [Candidatus Zixiibacteriota bacterium]|nr:MAG: glycosyltransferase family 39 protein [candidate division Zixibacteria bacterium]